MPPIDHRIRATMSPLASPHTTPTAQDSTQRTPPRRACKVLAARLGDIAAVAYAAIGNQGDIAAVRTLFESSQCQHVRCDIDRAPVISRRTMAPHALFGQACDHAMDFGFSVDINALSGLVQIEPGPMPTFTAVRPRIVHCCSPRPAASQRGRAQFRFVPTDIAADNVDLKRPSKDKQSAAKTRCGHGVVLDTSC